MTPDPTQAQTRRRSISLPPDELEAFLAEARTARVATVGPDGAPHVTPLWFVWHDGAVWLYSLTRSRRWADLVERGRTAVVVDDGSAWNELRGVEVRGAATVVGEQPRAGDEVPELDEVERLYSAKYGVEPGGLYDGRHAWVRISAEALYSWDHRRIPVAP